MIRPLFFRNISFVAMLFMTEKLKGGVISQEAQPGQWTVNLVNSKSKREFRNEGT